MPEQMVHLSGPAFYSVNAPFKMSTLVNLTKQCKLAAMNISPAIELVRYAINTANSINSIHSLTSVVPTQRQDTVAHTRRPRTGDRLRAPEAVLLAVTTSENHGETNAVPIRIAHSLAPRGGSGCASKHCYISAIPRPFRLSDSGIGQHQNTELSNVTRMRRIRNGVDRCQIFSGRHGQCRLS